MPTDVIFSSISTVVKSFGHGGTPVTEPKCDEERCSESHAAHENAREDVNKCAEETAVLPLVQEVGQAVDLCCRDHEHDNAHKNGEIAVGLQNIHFILKSQFWPVNVNMWNIFSFHLTRPKRNKLTVIFSPFSACEK